MVHTTKHEEVRRSYSITSSPILQEPLSIGIKRIANGIYSRRLVDDARVGDTLLTTGAGGFFCLPADMTGIDHVFFFAAGSGITPVYSLLKTLLHDHPQVKATLVYSNHSKHSTVFYEELRAMGSSFSQQLTIHFLFSDHSDLRRARLNRDLFFEIIFAASQDQSRSVFFTCGPLAYMRMVIFLLQESGVDKEQIRKEDFTPYHVITIPVHPPDQQTRRVSIQLGKEIKSFEVFYPDSILAAAKKNQISLPYSCETGKCGNCAARCLQGKVWLSNNEVLTENDLAEGLVLTCVGHPVGGEVLLKIG
jgi:ring-1,2-phenylacetyl-CoA epoxidase subunit PaaE